MGGCPEGVAQGDFVTLRIIDPDEQFFADHPDRQAHMRLPKKMHVRDKQRSVRIEDECEGEFFSLGPHNRMRRRIILWKVPPGNCYYDPAKTKVLKIPFLAFADETIEDRDDILLPIAHDIMKEALQRIAASGR